MKKPKFSIWLGDGWPGPYVVTFEDGKRKGRTIVVNGATSVSEALAVAAAEFPDAHTAVTIQVADVAEASHHADALRELRERESDAEAAPVLGED